MTYLTDILEEVLNDLDSLLMQLTEDEYVQPLDVFSGSSMGQHMRHILEFFQCLTAGIAQGEIDYDARKRDRQIESNPAYGRSVLQQLKLVLMQLDPAHPLQLRQTYTPVSSLLVPTNVGRELVYNIEHAIHHMAMLRIGVKLHCPAIQLPTHFGVAYSTILHQQTA
ncbi:DinB family protein [Spirosoma sp. SC4-14]|uniref:DinB family protein n=1 Tax=Spirosoma sp. SC4-14 TaxID=3128900 RepID=UPI0030D57C25